MVYIVVLHGNITLSSTHRAIDCFSKVLSQGSSFARAGEIHLRLGVMFKTKGDYLLSMDHFQKALTITGPASFSRLESKYVSVGRGEGGRKGEREREREIPVITGFMMVMTNLTEVSSPFRLVCTGIYNLKKCGDCLPGNGHI